MTHCLTLVNTGTDSLSNSNISGATKVVAILTGDDGFKNSEL